MGRFHDKTVLKRKIAACNKRLNGLKKQGFEISNSIYDELDTLEKKIKQPTQLHYIWKHRLSLNAKIIFVTVFLILSIFTIWFFVPDHCTFSVDELNYTDPIVISNEYTFHGNASCLKGTISKVQIQINNKGEWVNATGVKPWVFPLNVSAFFDGEYILSFRYWNDQGFHLFNKELTFTVDKPKAQFEIIVDDLERIKESQYINGSASSSLLNITLVQVKINDNEWRDAKGTDQWSYYIDVTDLSYDKHNLYIRCSNGESLSSEVKITFYFVEKYDKVKSINFINPTYFEGVKGNITIEGYIDTNQSLKQSDIQHMEIKFNEEDWKSFKITSYQWQYYWNTTSIGDGLYNITVRVKFIDGSYSRQYETPVFVFNNLKDGFNFIFPPGIGSYLTDLIPGDTYKFYGFHTKKDTYIDGHMTNISISSITGDGVVVTLEENLVYTPPDGEIHRFVGYIEISENATRGHQISIFFKLKTYPDLRSYNIYNWPSFNEPPLKIFKTLFPDFGDWYIGKARKWLGYDGEELTDDFWIRTGTW